MLDRGSGYVYGQNRRLIPGYPAIGDVPLARGHGGGKAEQSPGSAGPYYGIEEKLARMDTVDFRFQISDSRFQISDMA
jgi:hypothetical protein